jgi:hypothetical protein
MITFEENIAIFYNETESSVNAIIEGSDEHLDLILRVIKPLDSISEKFSAFNDYLYNDLNNYTDDQIRNTVLPSLKRLNKSCIMLIGSIRTSYLYQDVRQSLKNYIRHYEVLLEVIHDLQNIRLANDKEFDNLLKDLNRN